MNILLGIEMIILNGTCHEWGLSLNFPMILFSLVFILSRILFLQNFLFFSPQQLFLCVLPQDKSQWISRIKELRAWYSSIKEVVSKKSM